MLSEFAGELSIELSAGDTLSTIVDSLRQKFEALQPIQLSEREKTLTVSTREAKIQLLREKGISPVITNKMTAAYCADMAFSHTDDDFELCCSLVGEAYSQAVLLTQEKTGQQVKKQESETWADRTRQMKPVK
jgi:hypothetical protein